METMQGGDAAKSTKTQQGRKFGETQPQVKADTAPPAADVSKGVDFGQVLSALKAGKSAQRQAWQGAITLLPGADGEGNIKGLHFKTAAGIGQAGIHNNDLLAEDWIIIG